MISERYARKFCCEDLSLIENYDKAIADQTQTWDCHHRGEILPCGRFKAKHLKKFNLYYNRPANELIFLTYAEHTILHRKGVPRLDLKGVPLSEAHKKAIGEASSKKVLQFTKSGEFIREWPSTREAERELGIAQSSICKCCNSERKSAGGYVWKYAQNIGRSLTNAAPPPPRIISPTVEIVRVFTSILRKSSFNPVLFCSMAVIRVS